MTDSLGMTIYTYYDNNWLETSTDPHGFEAEYEYDNAGNIEYLTYPGNKVVQYEYNDLNRLHKVTPWVGQPIVYSYGDASRLENCDLPNGTVATYSYDGASRLTDLINRKSDASTIASYHFTLDGVGNRTEIIRTEPLAPIFSYGTTPYTYDGAHYRVLSAGDESFTYDRIDNLVSRTGDGTEVTYGYDYEQRLTQVSSPSAEYAYNGKGQRLEATRSGAQTLYILDGSGNVLAEADSTGHIERYYVYGLGLVAMITDADDLYIYHFNAVGSTIAMTDQSQQIVNSYAYTPFGIIPDEQEAIRQPFKYVGQHGVMAEPSGLYSMMARYYDPSLGRFLQRDPIGFAGGDLNLYVYVSNNPILFIDPFGLCRTSPSGTGMGILSSYGIKNPDYTQLREAGKALKKGQPAASFVAGVGATAYGIATANPEFIRWGIPAAASGLTMSIIEYGLGGDTTTVPSNDLDYVRDISRGAWGN